jgi:hypothetical protein
VKAARRGPDPVLDALAGRRVPRPPPELEATALATARIAGAEAAAASDWLDRVWESSAVRLLWTATTCGLLLAHLALQRAPATPPARPVRSAAAEELASLAPAALWAAMGRRDADGGVDRERQLALLLDAGPAR